MIENLSMGVSHHLARSELKCQSKVANAGGHVTLWKIIFHQSANMRRMEKEHLDKDVLGLEIPVGDRRLQTLTLACSKLTWFLKGL